MRFFFDTEFIESGAGSPLDLISIGMVKEGEGGNSFSSYYAISTGFNLGIANAWVVENVICKLERDPKLWKPRHQIADELLEFMGFEQVPARDGPNYRGKYRGPYKWEWRKDDAGPEVWAYFADYDWILFCQLFGRMVDLPEGMPFYCRDLKQLMFHLGLKKDNLPLQPETTEHNALHDALWVYYAFQAIEKHCEMNKINIRI